ncbi:MAG: polysaccharide deacetylase family protein [Terriglobales bacterium]
MRVVSPLLKHAVFPGLAKLGYLRRCKGAGLAIVTYHGITPKGYKMIDPDLDGSLVSADSFRRQLRLLTNHYNVISPQQFLDWCEAKQDLPPRSVLLTCDDDLRNTLTEMVPILQEHGLSCLFFVTGASLGALPVMLWYEQLYLMLLAARGNIVLDLGDGFQARSRTLPEKRQVWWSLVRHLSRFDAAERQKLLDEVQAQLQVSDDWSSEILTGPWRGRFLMLNAAEVRSLADAGMGVGAHTLTHPLLSQLPAEAAWTEIAESRARLEQAIGRPVWALAYPFGDEASATEREREMAERAGFRCAFLNVGGGFGAPLPRFALPRVHITGEMMLGEFEAHVSGFYRSLRQRFLAPA